MAANVELDDTISRRACRSRSCGLQLERQKRNDNNTKLAMPLKSRKLDSGMFETKKNWVSLCIKEGGTDTLRNVLVRGLVRRLKVRREKLRGVERFPVWAHATLPDGAAQSEKKSLA